jgi:hypothetical protein
VGSEQARGSRALHLSALLPADEDANGQETASRSRCPDDAATNKSKMGQLSGIYMVEEKSMGRLLLLTGQLWEVQELAGLRDADSPTFTWERWNVWAAGAFL